MAMIVVARADRPQSDEDRGRMLDDYARYNRDATEAGVLISGEALQPVETATLVRMTERGAAVTDGPFTESGDAVGGFYLLECENLDQAIEWAARIPDARGGAIEVRPVLELNI